MAKLKDIPALQQWAVILGAAALATAGLYFTVYKPQCTQNQAAQQKLQRQLRETAELESYRPRLVQLDRELADIQNQLDAARRVVPEQEEADNFVRMLDAEAAQAGIQVRRYTAKPLVTKDLYTEAPFELELDGPYFALLNFVERLARLERIVNVSGLLLASTRKPGDAKPRHTYPYSANETVVATCIATTYFSQTLQAAPPANGAPAVNKK
jgi:type IV pilus assembly protein PilO